MSFEYAIETVSMKGKGFSLTGTIEAISENIPDKDIPRALQVQKFTSPVEAFTINISADRKVDVQASPGCQEKIVFGLEG